MNASLLWPLVGAGSLVALVAACHGGDVVPLDGGATTTTTSASSGVGGTGGSPFGVVGSGGAMPDAGCPADASVDAEVDASTGCEGLEGGVSYTTEVTPIFVQSCNGELCHVTPSRPSLVGVVATSCCDGRLLVAPGNAAASYLIDKLTDHDLCSGGGMPLGKPALADPDILTIRRWICEGAPAQ